MKDTVKIYHLGDTYTVNQIISLAKGNDLEVLPINIIEEKLTGTKLLQLARKLDKQLSELVDRHSDLYSSNLEKSNYDEADWLNVLLEHPQLIKTPIAEANRKTALLGKPEDVLKLKNVDKSIDSYNHSANSNNH